jgi:hypothetical protein
MALHIDSLKAGQSIRCTISKVPHSAGGVKTLERLMRLDPKTKRGLRKAHKLRMQGLVVYNRGNRDWTKRETCGKIVRVAPGQAWTMCYTHDLGDELRSVEDCVSVEKA